MRDDLTKIIRFVLTILLLIVVWKNSHWSVALCLTFNAMSVEAIAIVLKGK